MKDCRIVLTVKDGKVGLEAEDTGMVELAELCGALQVLIGARALAFGVTLDDVKDSLLEVHLSAMRDVEDQEQRIKEAER